MSWSSRKTRRWLLAVALPIGAALALWQTPATGSEPHTAPSVPEVLDKVDVQGTIGPEFTSPVRAWAPTALYGLVFPTAPKLPPGPPDDVSEPTLDQVQRHLKGSDTHRALRAAQRVTSARKWGRDRDAAWLTQGLIHREEGRHNLASESFTKVRAAKGVLAEWGAFYEAEQDLVRGKPWVAVAECERYLERYPEGLHTGDCMRVVAQGRARVGNVWGAREMAEAYDEDHPEATISEQVEVEVARWRARNDPEAAIPHLRELAIDHTAALTGRIAEQLLAELRRQGHEDAVLPDQDWARQKRARSLRQAGRRHDAWALYEELLAEAEDNPAMARWARADAESFGWSTRQWGFLFDLYKAEYEDDPTGKTAWRAYRALSRGGRFDEAADWALAAQEKHGRTRHWRRSQEDVGRIMLLAGRYEQAAEQFDIVKARWGWSGRRAQFFAGFSMLEAGKVEDARDRLTEIVDADRTYVVEARYWRHKAHQALGDEAAAAADAQWVIENEPMSWYGVLLSQDQPLPDVRPYRRDGRWPGTPPPPVPDVVVPDTRGNEIPIAGWVKPAGSEAPVAFASLAWPLAAPEPAEPAPLRASVAAHDPLRPPESYRPSAMYDERDAQRAFYRFARANEEAWPELVAIYDLSRAGLYDLSGPLFSAFFEEWREAVRYRSHEHHEAARSIDLDEDEWRELFLFARDHHHATRFTTGLEDEVDDPALFAEVKRLQYPLAHDRHVWTHALENDLDPYLVLGLMRQESIYNAVAESRAGARGAMQIMPRTGHLLADVTHNTAYTANDLEDPMRAIDYGMTYLGLLMERFEGAYPLAVASYNGGPHNVSTWRAATGAEMPMDEFVEHIPFRETRGYVKKVTKHYAHYLAWYAPEQAAIALPPHPLGDHPDVVDF